MHCLLEKPRGLGFVRHPSLDSLCYTIIHCKRRRYSVWMCALEGTHSGRMMQMLGLLIIVVSVTLCDAQCWLKIIESDAQGCTDENGVLHEFNSKWTTKDCQSCSCSKERMQCCSLVSSPVDYDKEKCESIFYEETCSYKVVEKADPSKLCEVHSYVG
ncbi:beta-microseminoprotein J1-like [Gopherus evgoodei]|nr:beta-microseminoprotein J1-like [Gopherus evgoodei]